MDEKERLDNNEETEDKLEDTITVIKQTDPTIKEEVAPISSHKKIDASDLNQGIAHKIGRFFIKIGKRIVRRILLILIGIIQYFRDVFNFYAKNDFTTTMMYEYPITWHCGYILINSLFIALIPLVVIWRIIFSHHTFLKGMKLYPAMFKLTGILFVVSIISVFLLALIYKIIERLANKHNVGYFSMLKVLNLKGITLDPYIIVSMIIYMAGYHNIYALFASLLVLLDGSIISYVMLAKLLKRYHLIRNDRLGFIVPITFFYSLVYVLAFAIIYFTNSSLILSVFKILF